MFWRTMNSNNCVPRILFAKMKWKWIAFFPQVLKFWNLDYLKAKLTSLRHILGEHQCGMWNFIQSQGKDRTWTLALGIGKECLLPQCGNKELGQIKLSGRTMLPSKGLSGFDGARILSRISQIYMTIETWLSYSILIEH